MPLPIPTEDPAVVEIEFTVEKNYAGWRLDAYVQQKIRRLTPDRIQQILSRDLVCPHPLAAHSLVWPGLTFRLRRRARAEPPVPPPEALEIVHLDEALLVLDKPAGLPVHPTARYHHGTVVEQLRARLGFTAFPAHRLDRETSGLLLCGRTAPAQVALHRDFQAGRVDKRYLAIVEGHPPDDFEVDAPIALGTPLVRIAVRIDEASGKPARTRFHTERRLVREGQPFALVACQPLTGRQHQIRVHARHAGFPLVGDKLYGPDPAYFDRFSRGELEPEALAALRLPRHALHAAEVSLRHPVTGEPLHFRSPLPDDLARFL